jgi:outer membrane PBP1 activator LpoA protein
MNQSKSQAQNQAQSWQQHIAQMEAELAEFNAFREFMASESLRMSREANNRTICTTWEQLEEEEEVKDGELRLSCIEAQLVRVENLLAQLQHENEVLRLKIFELEMENEMLRGE